MIPEYLYRFDDVPTTLGVQVVERKFKVVRTTECGYWVDEHGKERWVPKATKKRFAYPTQQEAMTNFKARKRRQLEILEAEAHQVRVALHWVDPAGEYAPRAFRRGSLWLDS
jgi:hypothetical protein